MQSSHEVIDKDIEQQRRWVPLAYSALKGKASTGPRSLTCEVDLIARSRGTRHNSITFL
jgi:hypothetical protein